MRSGELCNRVTVQRLTTWTGSWGQQSDWRDIATVWASVVAKAGNEQFDTATSGVNSSTTYTVRMRYRRDVDAECRLSHCGRLFDVTSVVDPDGRRRELIVTCVLHGDGTAA